MKKIFLLLFLFVSGVQVYSQSHIISITLDPAQPTTTDEVKVYVSSMFTSGSCELDNKSFSNVGGDTYASAHHCLGMLTVICNAVDTFNLGYLNAANHSFYMSLTVGYGASGCSPGIVPDDTDTLHFAVALPNSVNEHSKQTSDVVVFPNPNNGYFQLTSSKYKLENVKLFNILGEVISNQQVMTNAVGIDLSNKPKGIYFVQITDDNRHTITKKIVVK